MKVLRCVIVFIFVVALVLVASRLLRTNSKSRLVSANMVEAELGNYLVGDDYFRLESELTRLDASVVEKISKALNAKIGTTIPVEVDSGLYTSKFGDGTGISKVTFEIDFTDNHAKSIRIIRGSGSSLSLIHI